MFTDNGEFSQETAIRVVIVREDRLEHRYHTFGELPNRIEAGVPNSSEVGPTSAR